MKEKQKEEEQSDAAVTPEKPLPEAHNEEPNLQSESPEMQEDEADHEVVA